MHDEIAAAVTVEVTDRGAASGDHRLAVGEQPPAAQHLLTGGQLQAAVGAAVLGDRDPVGDEERQPLRHRGLGIGLVEQGEGARDVRGGERRPGPARERAAGDRERARPLPRAQAPSGRGRAPGCRTARCHHRGRSRRRRRRSTCTPGTRSRWCCRCCRTRRWSGPPGRAARRRRRGRRPPRTPATGCCRSARRRSTRSTPRGSPPPRAALRRRAAVRGPARARCRPGQRRSPAG